MMIIFVKIVGILLSCLLGVTLTELKYEDEDKALMLTVTILGIVLCLYIEFMM